MLLSEDEAKTKVCCKERAHLENGKLVTPACLASGCMAFRWSNVEKEKSAENSSISLLELSVRATNVLLTHGINTIGKMRALSEREAMRKKNFGRKSWLEIQRALIRLDAGEIPHFLKQEMAKSKTIKMGYCGLAGLPQKGDIHD